MTTRAGVELRGVDQALASIAGLSAATRRAATRAQNKVAKQIGASAARAIAKANQLPVKALRKRLRVKRAKPDDDQGALVWVGTLPIAASQAGAVRETRSGAKAGRHSFPHGFVGTVSGGFRSVFERKGTSQRWSKGRLRTSSPNLPIAEGRIVLSGVEGARANALHEGEERYRAAMIQELNYELNVKGTK